MSPTPSWPHPPTLETRKEVLGDDHDDDANPFATAELWLTSIRARPSEGTPRYKDRQMTLEQADAGRRQAEAGSQDQPQTTRHGKAVE
jgi:hypothetical protein